jgi:hypothetical protein
VQLLKNLPAFYGTLRFVTMFTRSLHWSLSWARSGQTILSHHISLRSILVFYTHLRLVLSSGLFPPGYGTNNHYAFLFSPVCTTYHDHLVLLDFIILIILGKECKLWSSSLCSFLNPPHLFISPCSKNSPLHPVLKYPKSMYPLQCRDKFPTHSEPQAKLKSCVF